MTPVTVTVDEARETLPALLRRVEAGEEVVLTDGGRWVGRLAPPPPHPDEVAAELEASRLRAEAIIQSWSAERDRAPILPGGMTIQSLIDEQRRGWE